MTFDEAVAFLDSRIRWGIRPGLERMHKIVETLDHPERTFPVLHVSGTNGKFSVTVMAAGILEELGYTAGTYTSPHLESIRERFTIGGVPIPEEEFARVVSHLVPYIELVEGERDDHLTYFETATLIGFEWFFDRAVHVAVLEAGLGGEFDGTNVADAGVAVITKVARDHVAEFGDDIERATWEKAGIVKEGTFAVTGVEDPRLLRIVEDRCRERGAAGLAVLGRDFEVADRKLAVGGQVLSIAGLHARYEEMVLPVYGAHQACNAAMAIAACEAFTGGELAEDELRRALGSVRLPGRIEVVGRHPLVVVDGGHNPDAAATVLATLRDAFVYDRLIFVVGMLDDKLIEEALAIWAPACDRFVVTVPDSDRAADAERLLSALADAGVSRERAVVHEQVGEAIDWALDAAHEEDLVVVFGSFTTIGEARAWLRERGILTHP